MKQVSFKKAIKARHSVRQYKDTAIEAEKIAQLQALIDKSNSEAGLHMQLVTNEPNAKKVFSLTNGMGYAPIDLGIVKCHFEIAAGKENFEWL